MKDSELLSLCNERLNYDPGTGVFTWKKSLGGVTVGSVSGSTCKRGYINISLQGKNYKAHRLDFLIIHHYLPKFIDHDDKIKNHNWIDNIRGCTRSQNAINVGANKGRGTRYKGVSPRNKGWQAHIDANKVRRYLGVFKSENDAARAWNTAARMYQGHKFCYTNIIKE